MPEDGVKDEEEDEEEEEEVKDTLFVVSAAVLLLLLKFIWAFAPVEDANELILFIERSS